MVNQVKKDELLMRLAAEMVVDTGIEYRAALPPYSLENAIHYDEYGYAQYKEYVMAKIKYEACRVKAMEILNYDKNLFNRLVTEECERRGIEV